MSHPMPISGSTPAYITQQSVQVCWSQQLWQLSTASDFDPAEPPPVVELRKLARCVACHGEQADGMAPLDLAPHAYWRSACQSGSSKRAAAPQS